MRLNKYVQENLGISRRKFVSLVQKGDVFLNGQKVESYGHTIDGGEILQIKSLKINKKISKSNKVDLIVFNKPVGFVCSKSDKHNKIIYDILPKEFANYFYIGRLDKDSRGLLLMTNNSAFVDKFQHPSNQVEKEYLVEIDREFKFGDYKKIKKGVEDDGELLEVKVLKFFTKRNKYFVQIILLEGKKRHIRRILNAFDYNILDLQRVREGDIFLDNLKEGCWRRVKV
ncbi:MAG TPA: pseudouridine synthase [Candidatus Absconditabacterales bacterium]|nr:pseudouridine synthase [Candidatus Absconditabacterales bacterium]